MATNTPNLNLIKPDLTDPVDIGDINSNMDTLDELGLGYRYVDTIYYTSNGTFVKANYPWLRAIRVKVQAGGGGGGGIGNETLGSAGGGGGGYGELFITDITGLDASISVTRGGAGAGGTSGSRTIGNSGGSSSAFGVFCAGGQGGGNDSGQAGGAGGGISGQTTRDFEAAGSRGGGGLAGPSSQPGAGGHSYLGFGGINPYRVRGSFAINGTNGVHGGGGSGGGGNNTVGGAGGSGIVIVELYA